MEHGHWKRARPLVEARAAANANDARAAYLLSLVREAFGDLNSALDLAEKAVRIAPDSSKFHEQLGDICGEMTAGNGMFKAMSLGKRFKKEAELARDLDPKNTSVRRTLIEFYWRAPRMMGGSKDKARAMVEEILKIDWTAGALAGSRVALLEGDTTKAVDLARQAVEHEPSRMDLRLYAAQMYGLMRDWKTAEEQAKAALALAPDRAGPYAVMAQILARGRRWADLTALLERAVASVPEDLRPYYQAARVMIEEKQEPQLAEKYLRTYMSQEPEGNAPALAYAHWRTGLALELQGNLREAQVEVETAAKMKPDDDAIKKDLKRMRAG